MRMSWPSPPTPLPPGEQPCLVSSDFYFVVPSVTMFYHRIEDCQQLAHAGHHGDLVGLAVAAQALVKSANDRVVDPRGEGRHVQNGAHLTPATPGSAAALMFAAIVMKGGDADQGGDTLPIELSQFGQLREQRASEDRSDAGHIKQQIASFTPHFGAAQLGRQVDLQARDCGVEEGHVLLHPGDATAAASLATGSFPGCAFAPIDCAAPPAPPVPASA